MSFSYKAQILDYNGDNFLDLKSPDEGYRLRDLKPFDAGTYSSSYASGTVTKMVKLLAIWEKYEEEQ